MPDASLPDHTERDPKIHRSAACVLVILLASFAFFWHSRDWNTASRLMLVYAIGDRGTVQLDGLETQTNDIARYRGHYYTDKQPGYSILAAPIYLLLKSIASLPQHPLAVPAMTHWPADYWVTLLTSGVATAFCGTLLVYVASGLGCGPKRSLLVGLAYGLATPAYTYATLAYGHQLSAMLLFTALGLAAPASSHRVLVRAFLSGLLSALAGTVELSLAPVCVIVALVVLVHIARRKWPSRALVAFACGVAGPLAALLTYNTLVYGSPFEMGYAHHVVPRFRAVHGRGNPLGLTLPRWDRAVPLLIGEYRGLFTYAPITVLALAGWLIPSSGRLRSLRFGSVAACIAVFLVNLSYPEWTGGWSTGPRLLVPLLPFAMVGVASLLAIKPPVRFFVVLIAIVLSLVGAAINLGCQGVDGRIPDALGGRALDHPLREVVWSIWGGGEIPAWKENGRFGRNLVSLAWPQFSDATKTPPSWQWLQFLPLVVFQAAAIAASLWWINRAPAANSGRAFVPAGSNQPRADLAPNARGG